jgi:hypothetical protein
MGIALSLLGRFWPHLAALAALLGAVWFLDHRGYQRAEREHELAEARAAAHQSELRRIIERGMAEDMQRIENSLAARLRGISQSNAATQTIIEREVSRAPNLRSPACTMPSSVRDALNAAARAGDNPAPVGGNP